jgi:hypothetical protein
MALVSDLRSVQIVSQIAISSVTDGKVQFVVFIKKMKRFYIIRVPF